MARKRYSDEDVLNLLRQIKLGLASGSSVATACRSAGVRTKIDAARAVLTFKPIPYRSFASASEGHHLLCRCGTPSESLSQGLQYDDLHGAVDTQRALILRPV